MLVDTSVWIDHLQRGHAGLAALLEQGEVVMHQFVIGELACGGLKQRTDILALLASLPAAAVATHDEAMALVERHKLWGSGLGWIDIHLLASARLDGGQLLTLDRRLAAVAARLKVA